MYVSCSQDFASGQYHEQDKFSQIPTPYFFRINFIVTGLCTPQNMLSFKPVGVTYENRNEKPCHLELSEILR
jgi:hypothetical protein